MRTMLILVLLCSLAQFAIAQTDKFLPEGCGTIYRCFAPEKCDDPVKKKIFELNEAKPMLNDCPALIKFHEYRANWVHVSIESFSDDITSIVFQQNRRSNNALQSAFSCKLEGGKVEGKYKHSTKYQNEKPAGKLKCTFEVRLNKPDGNIFAGERDDKIQFTTIAGGNADKTDEKTSNIVLGQTDNCDPSKLEFHNEQDPNKIYAKIEYKPGKFECPSNVYKMEYRKEGENGQHNIIGTFGCNVRTFEVDGGPITTDWIDIRCVAEAHFFCKDDVMRKAGEMHPIVVESNWDAANIEPSTLKCPADKPHLIVNKKPIMNANSKIKCRNFGKSKFWTVEESDQKRHVLTKKGPEVYCSATLECHQLNKIPESSILNGRVNTDHLPDCFPILSGVLKEGRKIVTNKWCDSATGQFKYELEKTEVKTVDANTRFVCEYAKNDEEAKRRDKVHTDHIRKGLIIAAVGAALAVVCTFGVCLLLVRWQLSVSRKKRAKRNKQEFETFGMNKNERKAYKKDHNMPSQESSGEKKLDENWTWNKFILYVQHIGMCALTTDSEGRFAREADRRESEVPADESIVATRGSAGNKGKSCCDLNDSCEQEKLFGDFDDIYQAAKPRMAEKKEKRRQELEEELKQEKKQQ